jgi:adenylate cyclase class 2
VRVDHILKIGAHRSFKYKMLELKAKVCDHTFLRKKLSTLGAEYVGTFRQTDHYFKVPEGRLKLREVEGDSTTELIYYERENISGPKSDDAFILRIQEPEDLKKILKKILTFHIIIEKVREVHQYQGTKIHLDAVKKLGKFVEFERQTSDDMKAAKKDRQILEKLMKKLDIDPNNLESLSYSDLLQT